MAAEEPARVDSWRHIERSTGSNGPTSSPWTPGTRAMAPTASRAAAGTTITMHAGWLGPRPCSPSDRAPRGGYAQGGDGWPLRRSRRCEGRPRVRLGRVSCRTGRGPCTTASSRPTPRDQLGGTGPVGVDQMPTSRPLKQPFGKVIDGVVDIECADAAARGSRRDPQAGSTNADNWYAGCW
jgi:hypothetical protein